MVGDILLDGAISNVRNQVGQATGMDIYRSWNNEPLLEKNKKVKLLIT